MTEPSHNDESVVQLFGHVFNPQPFGTQITKGQAHGHPVIYLMFEYAHGRIAFPFSTEEAQNLSRQLYLQATGIVLPGDPKFGAPP